MKRIAAFAIPLVRCAFPTRSACGLDGWCAMFGALHLAWFLWHDPVIVIVFGLEHTKCEFVCTAQLACADAQIPRWGATAEARTPGRRSAVVPSSLGDLCL